MIVYFHIIYVCTCDSVSCSTAYVISSALYMYSNFGCLKKIFINNNDKKGKKYIYEEYVMTLKIHFSQQRKGKKIEKKKENADFIGKL